ncbi:universal stress protein PHOS34-like [Arachis stenosperma]|uniref:universal stress protein PHOS34-like n=1 Tax=Arachis stenosperma TaxID=217475 RepID=UPI0025ACABD4|nr:universal stress protein PHOS34-like [Arachis stenosperma]
MIYPYKLKKIMEEGGGGEERRMKMKAMVAIDESEGSFYALKWALDNFFIDNNNNNEEGSIMVYLVNVQPKFQQHIYPVGVAGAAFYPATAVMESVRKAQEESSAAILSKASKMCKDKLVKAESIILNGDPREMICQAAEQMNVNLLVIGSRGLGTIKRAFLGSVSDYCAHHVKIPIVIVKPPPEDQTKKQH